MHRGHSLSGPASFSSASPLCPHTLSLRARLGANRGLARRLAHQPNRPSHQSGARKQYSARTPIYRVVAARVKTSKRALVPLIPPPPASPPSDRFPSDTDYFGSDYRAMRRAAREREFRDAELQERNRLDWIKAGRPHTLWLYTLWRSSHYDITNRDFRAWATQYGRNSNKPYTVRYAEPASSRAEHQPPHTPARPASPTRAREPEGRER